MRVNFVKLGLDYTPIVGNQRQAPFKPAFKQIEVSLF